MRMINKLNATQYQIAINVLKDKSKIEPLSAIELLVLDLCSRVEYLENENSRIYKFCKRK